jgi:hypothetical protein
MRCPGHRHFGARRKETLKHRLQKLRFPPIVVIKESQVFCMRTLGAYVAGGSGAPVAARSARSVFSGNAIGIQPTFHNLSSRLLRDIVNDDQLYPREALCGYRVQRADKKSIPLVRRYDATYCSQRYLP